MFHQFLKMVHILKVMSEYLDNNLDLSKNEIAFPKNIKVDLEVARAAILIFNNEIPFYYKNM